MISTLQKYALREVIGPILLGLFVFTFVLFTAEIFDLMDDLLAQGVSQKTVISLMSCIMPSLLAQTIPMAVLVGVMLGFGRLSSELEIIAIRTSGINLWKLFYPVLIFAAIISVTLILLNFNYFPSLLRQLKNNVNQIEYEIASNPEPRYIYNMGDQKGKTSWVFQYQNRGKDDAEKLERVTLTRRSAAKEGDSAGNKIFICARHGKLIANQTSGTIRLVLSDGQAITISPDSPDDIRIMNFETMTKDFQHKMDLKIDEEEMNLATLMAKIPKQKSAKKRGQYKVELWKRISVPWACVVFAWLGMPLAILIRPRGKSLSYGFTIGLIFFYYIMLQWGESLGRADSALIGPIILAPNIILAIIGAFLMKKTLST